MFITAGIVILLLSFCNIFDGWVQLTVFRSLPLKSSTNSSLCVSHNLIKLTFLHCVLACESAPLNQNF